MALTLTDAQIAEIRRLRDAGPLNQTIANPLGDYSHIYRYISEQLESSDEKNWFLGATQANSGQGAYSAMIRGYSKRQMELRGIGNLYTPALMQAASNEVALRALEDILGENPLTSDDRDQHNGTWLFPTVGEIASNDAIGVGAILFDSLASGDTARSGLAADGGVNAGWAGTILFSPLDSAQTWRLTQGGGVGLNSLDDVKNILFAYDALATGMIAAGFASAFNYVFNRSQFWTDAGIGFNTWWESTTGVVLGVATQKFSSLLHSSAQPLGQLIEHIGTNAFLDMLLGAQLGRPVFGSTTDTNFAANAQAYFGALTPAQIQGLSAELMPATASAMVSKAKTDVNTRAALAALSSVSVQVSTAVAADLDLYDPATGTGELTEQYLTDRAKMLSWKMLYDSGTLDDNDALFPFTPGAPKAYDAEWDSNSISGDWNFQDLSANIGGNPLSLFIDGKGKSILTADPDHQIIFGSSAGESLVGQETTDRLYGGAGADTLTGNGGNDYLEGGAGFDTYVINVGDGYDTLLDTDGLGVINLGGVLAKGKTSVANAAKWIQRGNVWQDQEHGITYGLANLADGSQTLFITDLNGSTVEIKGWSEGELGIDLDAGAQPATTALPVTSLNLQGDLKPLDTDTGAAGIQPDYDDLDNIVVIAEAEPDRQDTLYDSTGNDRLQGHGGNDTLDAWRGGDDLLEGGSGQDWLSGGAGKDTLAGGADSDVLLGGADNDQLFGGDAITDLAAFILASETQPGTGGRGDWLSADTGADILVGNAGNDVLLGGENEDLLIGGGGNDNIYGDQSGYAGIDWTLTRSELVSGTTTTYTTDILNGDRVDAAIGAADVIYGGAGDDWIEGGQGNDIIDAGADNDVVFGGQGADVILGQGGNDALMGNAGVNSPQNDGGDYIDGGAGKDTIWGGGGNDTLLGGTEDDTLIGDGNGTLEVDEGEDVLDGGAGDDTLWGGGKADTLLGGADNDYLFGEAGNDTLDGGSGIDYLAGGADDDTYLNVSGDDTVFDVEGNNTIVLATAIGLGEDALSASVQTGDDGSQYMQLAVVLDDGSILKLDSPFFADGTTMLQFAGGDGLDLETLVAEQLTTPLNLQNDDGGGRVYGGAGDDVLIGGAGADVLVGHNGNDILQGGAGDDAYLGVSGGDTISDIEGNNAIVLAAAGLGAGGLSASVQTNSDGLQYMQLSVDLDTGGPLKLDSPFFADGVTTLQFEGGTTLDLETLVSESLTTPLNLSLGDDGGRLYGGVGGDTLTGGAGNDTLIGHGGVDTLSGGGGDDILIGGAGNDRYIFSGGRDTIVEDLSDSGSNALLVNAALADLNVTQQTEADGSQTLRLALSDGSGVDIQDGFLGAINSVTFSDNSSLSLYGLLNARVTQALTLNGTDTNDHIFGGAGDDSLIGLGGSDSLYGGDGNDVLNGGSGADILLGGSGNDIYMLDSLSGGDYINDQQGVNVIRFAADITPENLTASVQEVAGESSLTLRVDGQEVATISSGLDFYRFEFANLPQMSAAEFLLAYVTDPRTTSGDENANVLLGGRGDDALYGNDGDDVLQAGAGDDLLSGDYGNDDLTGGVGNDHLLGGLGSDIYRYNLGDGQDVIEEWDESWSGQTSNDSVVFGADITAADVTFKHMANGDLSVTVGGQDDALLVKGWYLDPANRVESFVFADGNQVGATVLESLPVAPTFGSVDNDTMLGVDGVDVLMGQAGDDLLIGNRGNDSLYGGTGVDTFRLTIGGGSDQIFEESGETSIVELYGQDLTRLSGTRMGDDLLLNISGSSESMTLKDYFTQTHDWQVKDTEGTVRVLDDLLTENATRNASLGEMDRLEERFVGSIKDAATQYFLDRGLAPQADGSWLSQPDFQVTKLFYDRERLPGWNGYVPADSAYYYFNNSPHYETGSFGLSVYSSDAIEMWPEDFGDPSYASWQLVPSKVQVTWSAQSQSTPKQTMNYVTGGYQYNEWQLMAILQSLQAINPSIAGISNRYIYTSTPTYTEQTTTTNLLGTVLSIAPDDGSGYNIDTANPASLFNLASLPNTLSVSLGVFTQERKLQVVEGGDSDNTIDFSDFYADIIVHAGTGNDTIKGSNSSFYGDYSYSASYYSYSDNNNKALLDGGAGDDLIEAGAGSDLIIGGEGNDTLKGGGGQDRYFFFAGQAGTDVILDDARNFDSSFSRWWNYLQQGTWYEQVFNADAIPRAHDFLEIEMANAYTTEVDWSSIYDYGGISAVISPDTAEFGEGIALSDIALSWGSEAVEVGQDNWSSTVRWHQTLDITWQPGAVARFVLPNPDDVHGFGVELFEFADGTQMTIGQMVSLAGGIPDLIEGTEGNDALIGTSASDWIFGFSGNDLIHGGDGGDYLFTGSDDSYLYGDAGNDVLTASYGNDWLDGGSGDDTMEGGEGNDVYVVDSDADVVIENIDAGTDIVQSSVSYTLGVNIENLTLTGTAAINGSGNTLDNILAGNDAANVLDGGLGADTMEGGAGNDTYVVDDLGDVVTETSTLATEIDSVQSSIAYTLGTNVENLTLTDTAEIDGTGNELDNVLRGNSAANILSGNQGNDTVYGGEGDDFILGGQGDDFLDGGTGADTMTGGAGNDTYVVDDLGDVVTETSTLATEIDSVQSSIAYTLGANFENLTLTGTSEIDGTGNELANVLRGNSARNVLSGLDGNDTIFAGDGDGAFGGEGSDTLISENTNSWTALSGEGGDDVLIGGAGSGGFFGGLGNDTITGGLGMNFIWGDDQAFAGGGNDTITGGNDYDFVIAGVGDDVVYGLGGDDNLSGNQGNDTVYGGAGDDFILGGQGDDFLDGGTGADTMTGGAGNDTYVVDDLGDVVTETSTLPTEIDTVQSSITYSLGTNVEHLTLTGTTSIDGTGNELANVLTGNSANNTLIGGAGDDILQGGTTGTVASTTVGSLVVYARGTPVLGVYPAMQVYIDGVLIQEFMVDAASYTAYTVDPAKLGMAAGKVDVVFTNDAWRPDLGQDRNLYVQKIEVNGQSMNATDNGVYYDPGSGAAAFDGVNLRLGQETLASNGALRFTLSDNDTLDGGAGADQMSGGNGNDTYLVDNVGDVLTEMPNEGLDTVRSSISHTLGANLENLTLTGSAAINGSGNALNNLLIGNAGNNILYGDAGVDTLLGYAGNDRLDGGVGNDFMYGGQGNDTYVVDSAGDILSENLNEGMDAVESSISHTLGANVESLTLTGTAAINGTGNNLDNALTGNGANNLLTGGAGNDALDGGAGADIMVGGAGDDYYVVDNAGDIVTENAGEGTSDGVELYLNADYTVGADIENVYRYGAGNWTTTGNAADNYLYGNSGSDTLIGLAGNDVLYGDAGADTLIGGAGDDRYYVDSAGDIVTENTNEGVDTVYVFGTGSLAYTLAANVENGYSPFWAGSLTGNALNNMLSGSYGSDTLDGGLGADTLKGWGGNDTYIVDNMGDIVSETSTVATEIDTVQSSVTYTLGANLENLTLTDAAEIDGTGNELANVLRGNSARNVLSGLDGNDTIFAGDGDGAFGGEGSDTLISENTNSWTALSGEGGDDVLIGGAGSGGYFGGLGNDTITGGLGMNFIWGDDQVANGLGGNDVITGGNQYDYVIAGWGDDLVYGLGGDDNLSGNQGNDTVYGGAGDDFILGGQGDDFLDGGTGADTMTGGTGNDTYILGRGYAADTVVENDATAGNIDIAQFLTGVAADQIWFQQVGNNLEASILGTSDKLVVKDWYLDTANHVEQFKTTDGAMTLLDSNVQNLVNAMASFAPPAAGQTSLPTDYQTSLAPVIAANWQ